MPDDAVSGSGARAEAATLGAGDALATLGAGGGSGAVTSRLGAADDV